jgi:hypothetical protein
MKITYKDLFPSIQISVLLLSLLITLLVYDYLGLISIKELFNFSGKEKIELTTEELQKA